MSYSCELVGVVAPFIQSYNSLKNITEMPVSAFETNNREVSRPGTA
jgi:hypothetical protein